MRVDEVADTRSTTHVKRSSQCSLNIVTKMSSTVLAWGRNTQDETHR